MKSIQKLIKSLKNRVVKMNDSDEVDNALIYIMEIKMNKILHKYVFIHTIQKHQYDNV